jgi:tetratricopeptide (TPR) repeat protein
MHQKSRVLGSASRLPMSSPRPRCSADAEAALTAASLTGAAAVNALHLRACVAAAAGDDRAAAKRLLQECLAASDAQHGGAWLLLARTLAEQGSVRKARDAIEQGLAQPGAAAWHAALWRARAAAETAQGAPAAAQASLARAIDAAQTDAEAAEVLPPAAVC